MKHLHINVCLVQYIIAILIGESGVGKTNIVSQYVRHTFSLNSTATIGVEFANKAIEVNGKKINLQLWDTAGQERYHSLTKSYYRSAHGALVVFDLTSIHTFRSLDSWINEIKQVTPNIVVYVAGNKCDLVREREVSKEEAEEFCKKRNYNYYEISALSKTNIDSLFKDFAAEIDRKQSELFEEVTSRVSFQLDSIPEPKEGCC